MARVAQSLATRIPPNFSGSLNTQLAGGMGYRPSWAGPAVRTSQSTTGIVPGSIIGARDPLAPASTVQRILNSAWGTMGGDSVSEYEYMSSWHNIAGRYDGRTLLAESHRLAEEILNARGYVFLSLTAPPLLVNEMYVTISKREPYIMPLDNIPMQGTPFESNMVATSQTYGLMSYKGMESITSEFLKDEHYGKQGLAEMSYVLGRRMLVTLVDNAAMAITQTPWDASVAQFVKYDGSFAGHYIAHEEETFGGVNKNPRDMFNAVLKMRTLRRPIDRIVVAENTGHIFKEAMQAGPKNMAFYTLQYDDATGRVIQLAFDNGPSSIASLQIGTTGEMALFEAPTMVSSSFDREEDGVQRLKTWPVIGEMVQERANLSVGQATGSVNDVDVATWAESMTEIVHPWLRHNQALEFCNIWNDFHTDRPTGPHKESKDGTAGRDDFGREYKKLMENYNTNPAAKEYLAVSADSGFLDNNTPPVGSHNNKTHASLTNWRAYYAIAGVYPDKKIAPPQYLRNISLRGLNPKTIRDAVLKIEKVGKERNLVDLCNRVYKYAKFELHPDLMHAAFGAPVDTDLPGASEEPSSVYEKDHAALAKVHSARDLASVIGELAKGPNSFAEVARDIPDSHMDQFIALYKKALDQLTSLRGTDVIAARENFKARMGDIQRFRGQGTLIQALTRASDKMAANTPLAAWTERLVKTNEVQAKPPALQGTFGFNTLLQARQARGPSAPGLGVRNTSLGSEVADDINIEDDGSAVAEHVKALRKFNLSEPQDRIYRWLLGLPFTYWTMSRLYEVFGISLFNANRYRNRQFYEMTGIVGFVSGQSYVTMFMHPQARSGVDHIHGMVSETIEFRSSVIPMEPESTFSFPNAFCRRLRNEINCRVARNFDEATSVEPDAPSMFCTLVPKDESKYDFPMSFTGKEIHPNKPMAKHSDTALICHLFDKQYLHINGTLAQSPVVYDRNGTFSDIIHRSMKIEIDPHGNNELRTVPGTGPRKDRTVNSVESHSTWVGATTRFPALVENCSYNMIESH